MLQIAFAAVLGTAPIVAPGEQPVSPDPASLVVPEEVDAVARDLVLQLGDPHFPTREKAHDDLRELGRLALPALRDTIATTTVPEIARRCQLLYPRANALEIRARVDCFSADTEGKYKHDLPGAAEFFAITGRTEQARTLFRDLILSPNRELITAVGGPEDDMTELAGARRAELNPRAIINGRRVVPEAMDILALVFLECHIPDFGGGVGINAPTYLLTQTTYRNALNSDPRKEAMQAITVRWFETRTEASTLAACMSAASSLRLPVAAALARKVIAADNVSPNQKGQAIAKLAQEAQEGKAEDMKLLADQLTDEGIAYAGVVIINGQRQNNPIEVRDVALAMSLLLAKQDPIDYGMKSRYANNPSVTLKYNYVNYHFDDADGKAAERRKEAFAKWYEYAAKNLKGYPKAPPPKDEKKGGGEAKDPGK